MADGFLVNVAEGIIGKLGNLALQEIGLLRGVKDEFVKLKETVSTIQAVLLDAEERQVENHSVRNWLERLKDAVHDADDLVDDFSTEALRREVRTRNKKLKKVRIFFSESNQLAYGPNLARKIKATRERLDAISADRIKFHLVERPVETQVVRYRTREPTHSFVREEEVMGREDDKKAIIQLLLDSNVEENVSVLPIVGIGGVGKTTLAQLVFNDEKVKKHFEKTIWFCVSVNFDVGVIVEKILESIKKTENPANEKKKKKIDMNMLVEDLMKTIGGMRYLLVLDDVWNDDREKWLSLKTLLEGGARGSRILVTTRFRKVAIITQTICSYFLRGLDEYKSWSLFKQKAFEKGQEPKSSKIVEIAKEIVKKCVGVPLAIRTIGSLLYFKQSEREWVFFQKNDLSKMSQGENGILPTLKLSYDHLPSHLKRCFAYCSLFPKDCEIDIPKLINLWIAQDFIQLYNHNQCFEDVGYDYFMDLLWGSFFHEVNKDEWGNIKTCKMHDLMHDLAILVAGKDNTILNSNAVNIDEKTRHVSFGFVLSPSSMQIPTPLFKASKIRTLLLLCQPLVMFPRKLNVSIFDAIVSSFGLLRVLDMHRTGIYRVSNSIGELKHLRHLDLSYNMRIKMLPNSVTKLQNLQTLRLSWCINLKALPRDIKKLVNLRYLEIDECWSLTHMPHGLRQLTNLRALGLFVVRKDFISVLRGNSGLKELHGLNNLRGMLRIKNLALGKSVALESKDANLKEKEHLRALELLWCDEDVKDTVVGYDEMCLEGFEPHPNLKTLFICCYGGVRFPSWLSSISNLVEVFLKQCNKCQYLPPLDQLSYLKIINLTCLDNLEYISLSEESGSSELSVSSFFPSLEKLSLISCPNLKGWKKDSVEEHHLLLLPSFPRLSSLYINNCPKLTSMPLFPYLKESLEYDNVSIKPLQQTMKMKMKMKNMESPMSTITIVSASSTSSSSSTIMASSSAPLANLKFLSIGRIEELVSLLENCLRSYTSLEKLVISSCPELRSLCQGFQHLTALKHLHICSCTEYELSNDGDEMQWQGLTSLCTLKFENLPKLESLPIGLQHVTTLQELEIKDCDSLMAIPEWIRNLTSLQWVYIDRCPNLTSLPQGMRALTSLQSLSIWYCPTLSQRCKRETGEDWPKISHVPRITNFPSLVGDKITS